MSTVQPALRLNEAGQCPWCLRKPLPYKRDWRWFCVRCCRHYRMPTGEQIACWAWKSAGADFEPTYPTHEYPNFLQAVPRARK